MSSTELSLAEQMSALMDGELGEEQARFLRRRLEHDAELRAAWSRLQLASSCLKGHRVRPMAVDCAAVRADATAAVRRPWLRYAVAASVAVLAIAMAPRFLGTRAPVDSNLAAVAPADPAGGATDGLVAAPVLPSPAAADLVAVDATAPSAPVPTAPARAAAPSDNLVATNAASLQSNPLPPDPQSPADFPLVDTGEKAWPRSGLPGAANDPQLEAYLVRHNQMLANGGLGGFVPYVDVVARDPARSAADALPAPATEPATK
jgi:hypothetical protein